MTFLIVLLLLAAGCHRETKSDLRIDAVTHDNIVTEAVTTAPTERVTERWHFSVTPGVGRAVPVGSGQETARTPPPAGSSPAGFPSSPEGYALDEYERVTEHLEPVATTKTTESESGTVNAAGQTERTSDVGFSLKFYLLAGAALAVVAALGIFLSRSKLVRRLLGVPL